MADATLEPRIRMMRKLTLALCAFAALWTVPATAQNVRPVDWNALAAETQQVLTDYIRINTTNPPGNELAAARYLKGILDREGIDAMILDTAELGAGRANLYARLKGNGSKRAVALVHHMDVVPVSPQYWSVDPFGGVVKDGYLYGRGTLDMKGSGIAQLMAMIAIKRSGVPLNRDIVFIANADEELGSRGALVFVEKHPDLLKDVEFLATEGGDNSYENGQLRYVAVGAAEKRAIWQHLVVKGVPSHGSRPTKQNPVPKLIAALDRISHWETPLRLTPVTTKYFHDIARFYPEPKRSWLTNISSSLKNPRARDWILSDVYWNAVLRNTISLTVVNGSNKTNVIPAEASADLDIRLLPDQDTTAFLAQLKRVAADTAVHFSGLSIVKPSLLSPATSAFVSAVERAVRDRDPNVFVTTPMYTAATDRPTYQSAGIIAYGIDPFRVPSADLQTGMHGNEERLAVANIGWGVHFVYDILRYLQ
jgi:acetylornithine deacetylase/succinyl-diaminopimelate desuccinylase-like protein